MQDARQTTPTEPVEADPQPQDEIPAPEPEPETVVVQVDPLDVPRPESAATSVAAESIASAAPTLGGSSQTQITNVVSRGFTPRPSTADKASNHQFFANIPTNRPTTANTDNESNISRSTAQRTNFSVGGTRRPPSRSHVPAIMPAYSFYHPLRPPAVANASGQRQMAQTKPVEDIRPMTASPTDTRPMTSMQVDNNYVHGKPSTEPLLPKPVVVKQAPPLHPVVESTSNGASRSNSIQMLSTSATTVPRQTPLPAPNINQSTKKTRNWQHFPGKTKYHLGGRVQFGTQYWANIGTGILVLIPTGLYFAFTGRYIWTEYSPALPITFAYISLLCLSSLIKASTSDPGILPRNIHVLPSEPTESWHLLPAPREIPIVSKPKYLDSPRYVTTKYCTTCRLWRPPRSSHCRVCDSCVEYCDHHCIWLNNCVGRRNYRYFFTFILSTALMGLYLTGQSIWYIIFVCHRDNQSLSQAIRGVGPGVSLALACYGILGAFYPLALVSYHFYLVMTGQNTHEYLRNKSLMSNERGKPYNRGALLKNFFAVLCWPKPITYIQPRAYFKLEDHRFDRLPMVGEGQWDGPVDPVQGDVAPVTDMPMTEIVRN